jgi:hypothetical protein
MNSQLALRVHRKHYLSIDIVAAKEDLLNYQLLILKDLP